MPGLLSDAIAESYASAPRQHVLWHTVELRHASFGAPVRLVSGRDIGDPLTAVLEPQAPLNPGEAVQFEPCGFSFVPPGQSESGPTAAKAKIDNVSGRLVPLLDLTLDSGDPIEVTYRVFREDETGVPGQVVTGLFLSQVQLTQQSATGELRYREVATQAFPLPIYDQEQFPGLFVS